MKVHPSSVGIDAPQLITKATYKLLDNDVKTAWINPRLMSKVKSIRYLQADPEEKLLALSAPRMLKQASLRSLENDDLIKQFIIHLPGCSRTRTSLSLGTVLVHFRV